MKATLHDSIVLLLLSVLALAASLRASGTYHAGSGTAADPYQIATAAQLIDLGRHSEDYDKFFILVADIDLGINAPDGKIFRQAVIAPEIDALTEGFQGVPFSGTFDGDGFIIRNLTVEYPDMPYVGLFGMMDASGTVTNLQLENCTIYGNAQYGAGALAGENRGLIQSCAASVAISGSATSFGGLVGLNSGEIVDCHTTGTIDANWYAGGLVGYSEGDLIQRCSSDCHVRGGTYVGGLVGFAGEYSLIIHSYAAGVVEGSSDAGGLVGKSDHSITRQCYAMGACYSETSCAGLVGDLAYGVVEECYSTGFVSGSTAVGGLVNQSSSNVRYSFWDTQASGRTTSGGGTGLPTAQMQQQQTFANAGWDFDVVWDIAEGLTYPFFQWQNQQTVVLCEGGQPYPVGDLNADCVVNLEDFLIFSSHWLDDLRP